MENLAIIRVHALHTIILCGGLMTNEEKPEHRFITKIVFTHTGMPRPQSLIWVDKCDWVEKEVPPAFIAINSRLSLETIEALGRDVMNNYVAACNADERRIAQGKVDWNKMSAEAQNDLNAFVFQAEGHTID